MVMRGRPAIGSMIRMSCGGRKMRSYSRNRGAKSVIRTDAPLSSVRTVETTAVLRTYSEEKSTMPSSTTSQKPFSSPPANRREKIGIAVEARIAPPHDPRRRIHQRRRAPVADDRKIEPEIVHPGFIPPRPQRPASQSRTSCGPPKVPATPATSRPTE